MQVGDVELFGLGTERVSYPGFVVVFICFGVGVFYLYAGGIFDVFAAVSIVDVIVVYGKKCQNWYQCRVFVFQVKFCCP